MRDKRRALFMMRPARAVAGFLAALIVAAALAAGTHGCAAGKDAQKAPPYPSVLKEWTKGRKIYEGLEARLYLSATYKSAAFREAYIRRYAASYELTPEYSAALLERERDQSEKYNEFFITAYTPDEAWNDFDSGSSVWKLYLDDDSGNRLVPISITRLDKSDPLLREFFPYFDLWSSAYVVKFPKYPESGAEPVPSETTKYMKLIVTGVLGKGELEWRLKK